MFDCGRTPKLLGEEEENASKSKELLDRKKRQELLKGSGRKNTQMRTKRRNAQKCTKTHQNAQMHAIPPFRKPPLACTELEASNIVSAKIGDFLRGG